MDHDSELRMIGFYVMRGQDHDKLINLSELEKAAYFTWMNQHIEEETEKYKAMLGGK